MAIRMDPVARASDVPHGTAQANSWTGTAGNDDYAGGAGTDTLTGGAGLDRLWGGLDNDLLRGSGGADLLSGGFGTDALNGGAGDDVLLSRSDAGEPVPASDETIWGGHPAHTRISDVFDYTFDPFDQPHDDVLTGGGGADAFRFEFLINSTPRQIRGDGNVPLKSDGDTDWMGIAMTKNGVIHYHWVDSIGDDVITDFNRAEGDKIELVGHTVWVDHIEQRGADSVIHLISFANRTGRLAHEGDLLGTITVRNNQVTMDDIVIDRSPFFGSVVGPNEPGVDPQRLPFTLDDAGVLPNEGFPGEEVQFM